MVSPPNDEHMDILAPVINAVADARQKQGMTQKELSARTGITQSDISKLENGNANPSVKTLKRLADALGYHLKIEFIRKS